MKTSLFFSLLLWVYSSSAQTLLKVRPTNEERIEGAYKKYVFMPKDGYGILVLILKKDSSYLFQRTACLDFGNSEGRWKKEKDKIILTSNFQKENIPIRLDYNGYGDFVDGLNIAVVRNDKGEPMTDAFVLVNNDSIKCLPLIGQCNKSFDSIERIKVLFENGLSSAWVDVEKGRRKVQPVVLTNMPISNYILMNQKLFSIVRGGLSMD